MAWLHFVSRQKVKEICIEQGKLSSLPISCIVNELVSEERHMPWRNTNKGQKKPTDYSHFIL
jgi:hypothetical protein